LPVDARYRTYNVENERQDASSILNYYHRLLSLRHANKALLDGAYAPLNQSDQNVLSYIRSYKGQNVIVVLNMSDSARTLNLSLDTTGVPLKPAKTLLCSYAAPDLVDTSKITVEPFGAWIGEIEAGE
jgi:glycosidase